MLNILVQGNANQRKNKTNMSIYPIKSKGKKYRFYVAILMRVNNTLSKPCPTLSFFLSHKFSRIQMLQYFLSKTLAFLYSITKEIEFFRLIFCKTQHIKLRI